MLKQIHSAIIQSRGQAIELPGNSFSSSKRDNSG
uniref:Uncharacterized protein n=1 Tax=Rhizophora mucronata TaxID=61149 RepID=A0A2P2Q2A5_RHIMU